MKSPPYCSVYRSGMVNANSVIPVTAVYLVQKFTFVICAQHQENVAKLQLKMIPMTAMTAMTAMTKLYSLVDRMQHCK